LKTHGASTAGRSYQFSHCPAHCILLTRLIDFALPFLKLRTPSDSGRTMQRPSNYLLILLLSFIVLANSSHLQAKDPTTKPTKSTTQPIPKDWLKVENKKYNYSFFVPKKWEKNVVNETQAAYLLPGIANAPKPLFLLVGGECHETTVEAEAATERTDLTSGAGSMKISKDQAAKFGGQPAWMFVAQGSIDQTLPAKPGQTPKVIKHHISEYRLVSVQGKVIYSIRFVADSGSFSNNLMMVQRVIDTFAWTAPATPQ
jgi:hypothetical protein